MNSIPASQLVDTAPSVLSAGGNPLSPNAVFHTNDGSIPIDVAQAFPTQASVADWFGAQSPEALLAGNYFSGFIGADSLPSELIFWQYNEAAVAGYLRGGSLSGLTLTQLQAFSGTLIVEVDGRQLTSATINLASATSFGNAATLIQTGLRTSGNVWSGTITTTVSTTVTVNTTVSGILHVGDNLVGTDIPVGATIVSFGTYDPGTGSGTVVISAAATGAVGPEAATVTAGPTVTYDQLRMAFVITSPTTGANSAVGFSSGTLAANILLTSATGAVISAGAVAATPASAMNALVGATQNFVSFTTVFEATIDEALGFANWVSTQTPAGSQRFIYIEWDSNEAEAVGAADDSFGAQITAAEYNGSMPNYDLSEGAIAAFICGAIASIDTEETNGRITLAYKGQAGLVPDVTDVVTAKNLLSNGYNFYGAYAAPNETFQFLQPGSMPGVWKWVDTYVNQILMNADFQLALLELEANVKSIPYNQTGYNLLRAALLDPIAKYVNFGAIQAGVPLSASQAQQVNTAAGANISSTLSTVGWVLQILPASPQVRGLRGSPPMKFWYTDGGSVQSLLLATIDVQ